MCTVIEKAMVEGQIKQFINQKRMFTAFDITKELRKADPDVKHYIVREAVTDIFTNDDTLGDYTRDLIDIPGKGQAYVYHLPEDDAQTYFNKQANPKFKINFTKSVNTWPKNLKPCVRDGRINIPIKMLKMVGIEANDQAVVFVDNNTLVVEKLTTQAIPADPSTVYKVFDSGSLQISRGMSKHLTNSVGDEFEEFTVETNLTGEALIVRGAK
jgi:hypothetical protein